MSRTGESLTPFRKRSAKPFLCVMNLLAAAGLCFAADVGAATDPRSTELAAELRNKGWVAYSSISHQGDWDLFPVRPDGSGRQNITRTAEYNELGVRFSPNGRQILFRRLPKATKSAHRNWGSLGQRIEGLK